MKNEFRFCIKKSNANQGRGPLFFAYFLTSIKISMINLEVLMGIWKVIQIMLLYEIGKQDELFEPWFSNPIEESRCKIKINPLYVGM